MFGLAEGSAAGVSGAIGWGRASSANGENLVDVGNITDLLTEKKQTAAMDIDSSLNPFFLA